MNPNNKRFTANTNNENTTRNILSNKNKPKYLLNN